MDLTEKCLESREVYKGRVLRLRVDTVALPNGKTSLREVVEHPGEEPFVTAQRELKEEVGATAADWQPLGQIIASPGCYDEVLHLYLARGLTFGDTHPDEDEFLSVRRIPFQELVQRCLSGEIQDGKTVTAVLKAKLLLGL